MESCIHKVKRTNKRTKGQTKKLFAPILSYVENLKKIYNYKIDITGTALHADHQLLNSNDSEQKVTKLSCTICTLILFTITY
jgi:hypothetical protein